MKNSTANVIWKYDETVHQRRMKRFYKYYLAPTVLIVILTAFIKDIGSALGVIILLGGIGVLIFLPIWMHGFFMRKSSIIEDGGYLFSASKQVKIEQITAFSIYKFSTTPMNVLSGSGTTWAKGGVGCAVFLLSNQEKIRFNFANIENSELDKIKAALERVLPNKWRPIEDIPES